jgi:hypothetical protein
MSGQVSVGARVQGWDLLDQALVLASIAQGRSDDGTFAPSDIADLFVDCALPPPARISNTISGLERRGQVTRGPLRATWKLTPIGRLAANDLLSEMDLVALAAEAAAPGASSLGHAQHAVISPSMAPPGLIVQLTSFLAAHPFERNVFGMTRFPDESDKSIPDPVAPALEIAREVCELHGLEFHLASDRAIDDDLWTNIAAHMWGSRYGIAFFENRRGKGVNYNLTIEVGSMLMAGRRCALLKDRTIPKLPTDLVGRIYKPIDLDEVPTVSAALHTWARDDLTLGPCASCP